MTLNRYLFCAAISVAIHSVYVFADQPKNRVVMTSMQQATSLNIQLVTTDKSTSKTVKKIDSTIEKKQQTPSTSEYIASTPPAVHSEAKPVVKTKANPKVKSTVTKVQQPPLQKKPLAEKVEKSITKKSVTDHHKLATTMAEPLKNEDKGKVSPTTQQAINALPVQIQQPSFKAKPQPIKYPRLAKRRNMQGETLVEIWLDKQGEQIKQRIISSSGYQLLDNAALASIKHWQFQGHYDGHQKIASRVQIPVTFTLN